MKKTLLVASLMVSSSLFAATRYDKLLAEMNALQVANPDKIAIVSIGKNGNGTDIQALRISSTPSVVDANKIGMLTVGVHHGNEGGAVPIIMDFAKKILVEFAADPNKAENYEFLLVPVINIPGYNANSRSENGVDPNRDYPGPCKGNLPNFRLKSTKAVADLFKTRTFAASVTIHGYMGTVTYPWGVGTRDPRSKDHSYFQEIGSKLAQVTGYRYGTSTDIVYPCEGAFEDWAYWANGSWALLFEIANDSVSDKNKNVAALDKFFFDVKSSPSNNFSFENGCDGRSRSLDRGDE